MNSEVKSTVEPTQIVTFTLGDEVFAADVFSVERILAYVAPIPLAGAPDWIVGMIRYQRRRVPVINLRRRFEMAAAQPSDRARTIVFSIEGEWVGAVADSVRDVIVLDRAHLSEPSQVFRGLAAEHMHGILRQGEELIAYLNVAELLSAAERNLLREIMRPPATS